MKLGIIGTGSMGTILLESFIDSGAVKENQVFLANRTIEKALKLKEQFPRINVEKCPVDVIKQSNITFLCTKPFQFPEVIDEIAPVCSAEHILVSITSPISVEQLEAKVDCKVARAIPSILNRALAGSSLLSFGERCHEEDKDLLTKLMSFISEPLLIKEDITRVSSDIVSCGPAFFSYLIQQFVDGAVRQTKISNEEATFLATNMMIGMGKLLEKGHYTLPTLQERVCVPGGITGEGIKVLEEEVGLMFDHLFQQTHAKYDHEREKIKQSLDRS
ncbi:late competence protein ComER [Bacillus solitudinis]|uniref:late competence protein ComER n=1 Tax=Bacillus solitudinis TaxID=2014074 RepID=UPI000C249931|nr:late competence protein ComER [Bacillus solitudinis]